MQEPSSPARKKFTMQQPLSTKKERMATPQYQRNLQRPRLIRSCKPPSTRTPHRLASSIPIQITFKKVPDNKLLSDNCDYNGRNEHNLTFFEQMFKIEKRVGLGDFGEVFKCRSLQDGKEYAVKRALVPHGSAIEREMRLKEVKNWEYLRPHRNLLRFIKAWEEQGLLYIQSELCKQSLSQYCEEHHSVRESMLWDVMVDMVTALDVLHSYGLLHNDLKPENILMAYHDNKTIYKLCDFGLVVDLKELNELIKSGDGDSRYLAPENLNSHPTKASDIFSLGITMLEVASDLDVPSHGPGWQELREGKVPGRFLKNISKEMRRLITWMMHPNPQTRPSTHQLLSDSIVREKVEKRWARLPLWEQMPINIGVFVFAVFLMILRVFRFLSNAFMESRQAANSSGPLMHTPEMKRGPLVNPYSTHTPASRGQYEPRRLRFDDFSDEEILSRRPCVRSRGLFAESAERQNSRTKAPKFNFDDDEFLNDTCSSTSVGDEDRGDLPLDERLPDDPQSSPSISPSSPNKQTHETLSRLRDSVTASGDWNFATPLSTSRPRRALREVNRVKSVPRLDFSKCE